MPMAPSAWFQRFTGYALPVGFTSSRSSSTVLLQRIIFSLHKEFDMTDLGALNYFLRISVTGDARGMFLSQKKYAIELLERAHMSNCGLQYLTFTMPDISYAMQHMCLYLHDPREPHLIALKRVLRYIRGTFDFGLQLYASSTSSLVAYSDADWPGCPTTRRSTSGYHVFFGNNLLSWSLKQQQSLSHYLGIILILQYHVM
ncbi:ribonuclease H-like domain-containing protein [Tanacetum coccineum]|uniref:Ribonuclease H-like domain-containing protein n=1 Tax=Tanacetum coccineum TaxID=301880 RepID=A0ABQ4WDD2_9ASTR